MVGRNAQRCRSFSECAGFSSVPAREYPAAVSEKVLIRRGDRRDASTNCTAASSRTYEPLRICRGALCCSIDVGLCPVRASIATARSARLHARSWIRGRPKLCLLAWSRLWVWDWVWRGLLGPSIRLLRYSLRSIWASGVWVVWRIRRIWCSASAVRCAGPSSHASEPCSSAIQEKILRGLPRSSNDREPPKVPTASLVVTPIESVLYPFQYGLVSKVIRHRLPLHVDVRMLRVSSGVMCVHPRGMREYHANQAIGDDVHAAAPGL